MKNWIDIFVNTPKRLTLEEKVCWLKNTKDVSLGSDAFSSKIDNVDIAQKSGVKYIVKLGG